MSVEQLLKRMIANVDDLQAAVEASARSADAILAHSDQRPSPLKVPIGGRKLPRHVAELRACGREQHAALQELRDTMDALRHELVRPNTSPRLSRSVTAARQR